jgi:hypothetical protein
VKRCWLVPKLSLLLHMSQAYVLSCVDAPPNLVPHVDGLADAADLINIPEPLVDRLLFGGPANSLLFQHLLLGLNINLLTTMSAAQKSANKKLYGFEFMDVATSPGRGSYMKKLDIASPGKDWLTIVNVVDAVVVCASIGNVITVVLGTGATIASANSHRDNPVCSALPEGLDYLAATVPCLARLVCRRGGELAASGPLPPHIKISNNGSWDITGDPFRPCTHGMHNPDTCWKRKDLIQRFTTKSVFHIQFPVNGSRVLPPVAARLPLFGAVSFRRLNTKGFI